MPDVSHPAPCAFGPRISPIDSTAQLPKVYCAAPGIVGRRVKWKRKWKRTSCPAGAGRALRNISAATFRGRPPGNDAGSDRLGGGGCCPSVPAPLPLGGQRWTKVDRRTLAGRSRGSTVGTDARLLGPPDSCRPCLVWERAEKEEPTELILAGWPHGSRLMVRCARLYTCASDQCLPDWGSHPSFLLWRLEELLYRLGSFFATDQKHPKKKRPHFWWPWDASIGKLSCAQAGYPCPLLLSAVSARTVLYSTALRCTGQYWCSAGVICVHSSDADRLAHLDVSA